MSVLVFGIRHHGPGSARSLLAELELLQPDAVLVEGPPEADEVLRWATDSEMKPPVALLVHRPDSPGRGVFYPFATFSPEWQAIRHGLARGIPVRFIDLPASIQLADSASSATSPTEAGDHGSQADRADPIRWLAEAAGEADPERWWERMVEQRGSSSDVFGAVLEAMTEMRSAVGPPGLRERQREAHMRQAIRAAEKEGLEKIAVVCGAWHAPALHRRGPAAPDAALLRGLRRSRVEATWVPWTQDRLALETGYGAGVESPGWYEHLWSRPDDPLISWMARTSTLLRAEDLDASPAQTLDATRLALTLAALRERSAPTLSEVIDASVATFGGGSDLPLQIIRRRLIVGEGMGSLPADAPVVPLQRDLEAQQRKLRLKPEPKARLLELDLRRPLHLESSHLLHRLDLLGIRWGRLQATRGGRLGTFHEDWQLRWQPELALAVVEAGTKGSTVLEAAVVKAIERAAAAQSLADLAQMLQTTLLADLSEAMPAIMSHLLELSALATDVASLLDALPRLVASFRYGSVRKHEVAALEGVVDSVVARAALGLPTACVGLDDSAAAEMVTAITQGHRAVRLLQKQALIQSWWAALAQIAALEDGHGLVEGRVTRFLLDGGQLTTEEVGRRLGRSLGGGAEVDLGAAWFEGFLADGGMILLTDDGLFGLVDTWISEVDPAAFDRVLPLLRRTVSTFPTGERRQIGERVRAGSADLMAAPPGGGLDPERLAIIEPVVRALLGMRM